MARAPSANEMGGGFLGAAAYVWLLSVVRDVLIPWEQATLWIFFSGILLGMFIAVIRQLFDMGLDPVEMWSLRVMVLLCILFPVLLIFI